MCSQSVYPPSRSQAGDLGKEQKSVKQIETKSMKYPVIPTKPRAARTTTATGTQPNISSVSERLVPAKDHKDSWCIYTSTQSNKISLQKGLALPTTPQRHHFATSPRLDLPSIVTVPQLCARHCNYCAQKTKKIMQRKSFMYF